MPGAAARLALREQVAERNRQILQLSEEAALLRQRLFGRKPERAADAATPQLALFNEAESPAEMFDPQCGAPEHDDTYIRGELAVAAAAYATAAHWHAIGHKGGYAAGALALGRAMLETTPPRRDQVKAGALILAKIERLDRMERIQREAGQ